MTALRWVVLILALQRGIELLYAERNTRRLRARGAVEIAPWQHPLFVALHAAWLLTLLLAIPPGAPANWWLLGLVAAAQLARFWIIASLGPYWTTRIITIDEPLVRRGPYRIFPHPNYAIVCIELAAVPLAFGAWRIAVIFTLLNAALLSLRIPAEERALRKRLTTAWQNKQRSS
jgi:methyltransferase